MTNSNLINTDFHKPVLLNEMIEALSPKDNEIYLDGTFGAGGYSKAILQKANCKVFAIDCDESAKRFSAQLEKEFPNRFKLLNGKFSNCQELLAKENITKIDGMVFDIGVSSMQFDDLNRGFSFDSNARLDMRMDNNQSLSAFEVVNEFSEKELEKIIKEFGEERKAKLIAKRIVANRKIKEIETCLELAKIARSFYYGHFKTDPATKTFQAIRIFVNQELEELKLALNASISLLQDNGRLVVVSFHSLEDKIVKDFFKKQSGLDKAISRYEPEEENDEEINFYLNKKSAISPSEEEIKNNPRSRSAKLRVGFKKMR